MNLTAKIRSLFDPAMYQGWGNRRKYFEGWYFKVVNASGSREIGRASCRERV